MAKFGPGTKKELSVNRKDWKVTIGAIENKNRPEALYIVFNSWVKPKLSVVKAQNTATHESDELVGVIMSDFEKELKVRGRSFKNYFNSKFFDPASLIFDYSFIAEGAEIGKRQFLELEFNIDTVNDIDWNGGPAQNKDTGKVNNIPFASFESELQDTMNRILDMDIFNESKSNLNFSKVKGAA